MSGLWRRLIGLADEPTDDDDLRLRKRVGVVIGHRRILFDLWGDTVNLASRMQTTGVAGRIQVTSSTRDLLGDRYEFEDRGSVDIKGLGPKRTFLLTARDLEAK